MVSLVYLLQSIFHCVADNLFQGGGEFSSHAVLGEP
jgi:hypothetical protein